LVDVGRVGFFFETQDFVLGMEFVGLEGIGVRTKSIKQFKTVPLGIPFNINIWQLSIT
jgi:hypothetical protein